MADNMDRPVNPEHPENKPLSTADMAKGKPPAAENPPLMRQTAASGTTRENLAPLLNQEHTKTFRDRWSDVQTGFVDEPRHAVEQADNLVAQLMQQLAQTFAAEREKLEGQWNRGQDVSTEDLRLALQRYRSFFDRLLSL